MKMYSAKCVTVAHSKKCVRMTGGRRQASDAVHSHVIGALELSSNQGGWCQIFNFNLVYNFAPGATHTRTPTPRCQVAQVLSRATQSIVNCRLVGRGRKSFTLNCTFLEQSYKPPDPTKGQKGTKFFFSITAGTKPDEENSSSDFFPS